MGYDFKAKKNGRGHYEVRDHKTGKVIAQIDFDVEEEKTYSEETWAVDEENESVLEWR